MTSLDTQQSVTQMVRVQMALRRERQADLAGVLGIGQPSVSNKLSGRTRWSVDDLDRLARHWNMGVADLILGPVAYLPTASGSVNARERTAAQARRRPLGGAVLIFPTQRTHFSEVAA